MKRREAIKTIIGIGVITACPGILTSLQLSDNNKTHFIGLGGGGTNVLEYFKEQNIKGDFSGIRSFLSTDNTTKNGINYFDMFPYIEQNGWKSIDHNQYIPNELQRILHVGNNFVFIAGLGGRLGANLLSQSVKILNQQGKKFTVIAMLPFAFEGAKRKQKAHQLCNELKEITKPIILDLENEIKAKYGDMRIAVAFEKANEEMYLKWSGENLRTA